MRPASATAALIEHDDAIVLGIEEPPGTRIRTAAGTAVQEYNRLALTIAAFLKVNFVQLRDTQEIVPVRRDRRIQTAQCRCGGRLSRYAT